MAGRVARWSLLPQHSNTRPQVFMQTVVQSDGSTITVKTCSPRPLLTTTKDTRNHLLWNPERASGLEEGSVELAKFALKYGAIDMTTTGSSLGFAFQPVVTEKKVVEVAKIEAVKTKGKTKK